MKIQVPQSAEHQRVMIEVTGPDILRRMEVSTEVTEIERQFDVDDRLLTVKAWFISNSREPVGAELVLQRGEAPEPEVCDEEAPEEDPVGDVDETPDEEVEELSDEPAEVKESRSVYQPYKRQGR